MTVSPLGFLAEGDERTVFGSAAVGAPDANDDSSLVSKLGYLDLAPQEVARPVCTSLRAQVENMVKSALIPGYQTLRRRQHLGSGSKGPEKCTGSRNRIGTR